MVDKIPADSTIETVWPHLTNQKPYVSGALHKLRQCNGMHGNASVRIGVTGTGQRPYYRITYTLSDGDEQIFGSFYDNHDPLGNGFVETSNWSSRSMLFDEVLHFYADAIGHSGKRA
jgi:hypothetical protein